MEHYTIRQVQVLVRHEDGTEEWLAAELHDGCRTVLVGLDACSTAGAYYRDRERGLAHLTGADDVPAAPAGAPGFRAAPAVDIDLDEEPGPVATHTVPDLLEFRQGKWYCR